MKQLKELREARKMAYRLGLEDVEVFTTRRGHPRVTGSVNGKPIMMVIAGSPSDVRSQRNREARLKRLMREAADA